jgi:uncharacterized phage protein gp47/JayE
MAFVRPTLSELVDRVQADLVTRLALTGAVLRRSLVAVLARVLAGATHQLHGHLEFLSRQIFPDTSELEYLERQAGLYGLTRTAATYAVGSVTLTGTNAVAVPAGTVLQRADGTQYETDAEVTIASGTATAVVTAVEAGAAGNADVGTSVTFVSPIAGVTATATVASGGLTSGADAETDEALRIRLTDRLQQPPHGGAEADYVTWAKEVAGVTRAWGYPLELGAGTVTVRFVRDNDASLIPDAGEVTAVQAYIDARRPVTAAVTVVAPVAVPRNFTLHIVPDTAATRAAVEAELEDLLERDAEPGATLLLSQIKVAVGAAAGVTDFSVTSPAADVTHTTGQIATMGTITWV